MVSSAASCFAGVTPAQHEAITLIGVSGMNAFRMRAFETTQMSVQRPMRHISRSSPPSREHDVSGRNEPGDVGLQLPAVRSFDAMLHWQHSAFLRAQVGF